MRALISLMAVGLAAAGTLSAAQAQQGGGQGNKAGSTVILGSAGTDYPANIAAERSSTSCLTEFGDGARWANTKDLQELPWSPDANTALGWINIYPVGSLPDGRLIDISGHIGLLDDIACGSASGTAWAGGDSGLAVAAQPSYPLRVSCDLGMPVICVGPER